MKITLTSHGTRGDVQPYLALAVGLQAAGHQATLCTSYNYSEWIESYGVGTHPTQFSIQEYMKQPEVRAILEGRNFPKKLGAFRKMMAQGPEAVDTVWEAVQGADYVIASPASTGAVEAAQTLGKKAALAYPVPMSPTGDYPSIFIGSARFSLGKGYNRLTHRFMHMNLWNMMSGPMANKLRKQLDLPKMRSFGAQFAAAQRLGIPSLYGFSEHVLPKPADWGPDQHITGYWFLPANEDWQPDPALESFLAGGPAPVYLGFGSINPGESEKTTETVLEAVRLSGERAVLLTGWGGLVRKEAPENCCFIENVPHDWLFPRMAALVHHGGAGTTGAGLRAGVPNIITPIASDQYFWAERAAALGVGPEAPPAAKLTPENLAPLIQQAVRDEGMRSSAAALGEKIRAEEGIGKAVAIIEEHAAG